MKCSLQKLVGFYFRSYLYLRHSALQVLFVHFHNYLSNRFYSVVVVVDILRSRDVAEGLDEITEQKELTGLSVFGCSLAVGTAYGYALVDYALMKTVHTKCTLGPAGTIHCLIFGRRGGCSARFWGCVYEWGRNI